MEHGTAVAEPIRIVLLEDAPSDAELVVAELRWGELECTVDVAATRDEFLRALDPPPDLILADYSLPAFDGLKALEAAREILPDIPFIIVSGAIGEEVGIDTMKAGATDYVLKDRLSRLVPAARRALAEAKEHTHRLRAESELRENEARLRAIYEHSGTGIALVDRE